MEAYHSPISMHIPYSLTTPPTNNSITIGNCMANNTTNAIANPPPPIPTICSPFMDSRIWSRLPHRLIDRIIAFLPPPAFFRARAVCKRWYGLLFSNTFLQLYIQISSKFPHRWFIFLKHNKSPKKTNIYRTASAAGNQENRASPEIYIFDPYTVTWYRVPISALIPPGFSPASTSGGLICFTSEESGSKSLILYNPLVNSLTPLPSTLRPRLFPSVGLNISNSSIDITVAGDDMISPFAVKNLTSENFHIDAGGFYSIWGTNSSLPRLCSLESGKMVHVEGKFYCMNYSPFSVLSYDVASNHWCKIQAPMRRFLRSPSLVESGGKLILVAAVEKSKLNVPRSLRLWTLQECGTMWVEIERMPQQLYSRFAEIENGNGFDCVGHGDFVVILIKGSSSSDKALMFDFEKKRWMWVPPCPYALQNHHGDETELHGFAYEPRLATPVTTLLDQLTLPFNSAF